MTSTEIERELRAMQNSLEAPFLKARAAGDQDEMDRLQGRCCRTHQLPGFTA